MALCHDHGVGDSPHGWPPAQPLTTVNIGNIGRFWMGCRMIARLLFAAAAAAALATPAQAEKVVVTADRYLDVATGRYVEGPAIFIGDDGRITAITQAAATTWPAGTRHI